MVAWQVFLLQELTTTLEQRADGDLLLCRSQHHQFQSRCAPGHDHEHQGALVLVIMSWCTPRLKLMMLRAAQEKVAISSLLQRRGQFLQKKNLPSDHQLSDTERQEIIRDWKDDFTPGQTRRGSSGVLTEG